ncbi:MAG: hypothetical protein IH846_00105 [Acidobacteria bacterium]|nr:hypothetical protein [Acidobacteriota bacterium]
MLLLPLNLSAQKFYEDDPITKVPPPMNVENVLSRKLSDYYDFFYNTLSHPGERHTKTKLIPAQAVNTLGEVPDSSWYTNRHYHHPMTVEELVRGPGDENAPSMEGRWRVVAAKAEGITPGFTILDSRGLRYILKFDPLDYPEIATAADMIASKFFYALGYPVPENYLVFFNREQLVLGEGVLLRDPVGNEREMTERDVTEILLKVPRNEAGEYRGVASFYLEGTPVGPFRYHGTRKDDPNDIVPHEHRRDLRGLSVFCAWLGHDDSRSINTLDMLVRENGVFFVKHHLIDFGSTLGSASNGPNTPRSGHEYMFAWKPAAIQFFTFGLIVPRWARAKFPDLPSVGRFESEKFDAEGWVPEYPNPAFSNRLPDDAFWAAKQVMAFTDPQIRAIVKTGQYSNPEAEKWIADRLIERRDKIGKAFLAKMLPLDRFAVQEDQIVFENLAVKHRLAPARDYVVQWSRFNNDTEKKSPLPGETTFRLPSQLLESAAGEYFAADIHGGDPKKTITVYLRKKPGKRPDRVEVVGMDRTW